METQSSVQSIIQYKEPIPTHDIFKVCILNDATTAAEPLEDPPGVLE